MNKCQKCWTQNFQVKVVVDFLLIEIMVGDFVFLLFSVTEHCTTLEMTEHIVSDYESNSVQWPNLVFLLLVDNHAL